MQTIIEMTDDDYSVVVSHLLPREPEAEEAAFLFATSVAEDHRLTLRVVDRHLVEPSEFRIRSLGHLELREDTHERMIRRAHELNGVIIEVHSHPYSFDGAACFSGSDRAGLAEIVPHIMWRLPGRPYVAMVFAPLGFDALIWTMSKGHPRTVDEVMIGNRRVTPTGYTMTRGWRIHGSL